MRGRTNLIQGQGAVTTSVAGGGTTNTVCKFTGSYTIGDSLITDNGTTITLGGTTVAGTDNSYAIGSGTARFSNVFSVLSTVGKATNLFGLVYIGSDAGDSTNGSASLALDSIANQSELYFRRAGTSQAARSIVASGDAIGMSRFYGWDGSAYREAARFNVAVDGTPGASDMPGRFERYTTADGASSPTLRETLSNAGAFRWHAYGAGTLTTDGSGNITAVSDETLKLKQADFTDGLDAIRKINPVLYKWRPESGMETEGTYAGFFAQNVAEASPSAVGRMNDGKGTMTLQDRALLAMLVNAVKELAARV